MTRLLVVGTSRSGKSWTGSVLAFARDAQYLDEPDNHFLAPYALHVKRRMRQRFYPSLTPYDDSPEYEALWQHAFRRGNPSAHYPFQTLRQPLARLLLRGPSDRFARFLRLYHSVGPTIYGQRVVPRRLALVEKLALPDTPANEADHVIVSSAYAHLAAGWIADRLHARVVIVRRNLASLLGTWIAERWLETADLLNEVEPGVLEAFARREEIALPRPEAPAVVRGAWLLGFLTKQLKELATQHPEWAVVDYEELVTRPYEVFPRVATQVGLEWTSDSTRGLEAQHLVIQARRASLHPSPSLADRDQLVRTLKPFELGDWGRSAPAAPS